MIISSLKSFFLPGKELSKTDATVTNSLIQTRIDAGKFNSKNVTVSRL